MELNVQEGEEEEDDEDEEMEDGGKQCCALGAEKCGLSNWCCWQWWLVYVQPAAAGKRSVGPDAGVYLILVQLSAM